MKKQIFTLSFLGFIGALFAFDASAAPTIKKLGATNNAVRANTSAGVKSDGNSSLSRISSARLNPSKPVKTAVVSTTGTPSKVVSNNKVSNVSVPDSNESRLSLGKYLHSANVNKTGTTPNVASTDFNDLQKRVDKVEADAEEANTNLENHINNTDIHVTVTDKDTWNDKQDALTAGTGIKLEKTEDNTRISSFPLLPVSSPNAEPSAPIWIE